MGMAVAALNYDLMCCCFHSISASAYLRAVSIHWVNALQASPLYWKDYCKLSAAWNTAANLRDLTNKQTMHELLVVFVHILKHSR